MVSHEIPDIRLRRLPWAAHPPHVSREPAAPTHQAAAAPAQPGSCDGPAKYIYCIYMYIWLWVKTLYPFCSHQNSWDLWIFIHPVIWYHRFWPMAIYTYIYIYVDPAKTTTQSCPRELQQLPEKSMACSSEECSAWANHHFQGAEVMAENPDAIFWHSLLLVGENVKHRRYG